MDGHVEHMADKTLAKNVHHESIMFSVQFRNLLAGILKKIVLLQIDGNLVTRYIIIIINTFLKSFKQTFTCITYLGMLVIWLKGSRLENSAILAFCKNLPLNFPYHWRQVQRYHDNTLYHMLSFFKKSCFCIFLAV